MKTRKGHYLIFRFVDPDDGEVKAFVIGWGDWNDWKKMNIVVHGRYYPLAYASLQRAKEVAKALKRRKWVDVTDGLLTVPCLDICYSICIRFAEMTDPSPFWTAAERLALLRSLVVVSWHEHSEDDKTDARLAVLAVLEDSATDLELNRANILSHARRRDEIMGSTLASRPQPGPDPGYWKVVNGPMPLQQQRVDFTDLFFQFTAHTGQFTRAATPVFEPTPNTTFAVKSLQCWLKIEADEYELDSARLLAMASVFAPEIAEQLVLRGQRFVYSVFINRPVLPGNENGTYLASRYYRLFARTARALTPEEMNAHD